MNQRHVVFFIGLFLICSLFNCQDATTSPKVKATLNQVSEEQSEDQISPVTAHKRVRIYNDIYGPEGTLRYLTGNNKKVVLPRYFAIDSTAFHDLIAFTKSSNKELYASLNTKNIKNVKTGKDTLVSNLIFHQVRPYARGGLDTLQKDTYVENSLACPINCEQNAPLAGRVVGKTVIPKNAIRRVKRYNNIYGPEGTIRYIASSDGRNMVFIPRYFAFSEEDIENLLKAMTSQRLCYISLGAEREWKGDKDTPTIYISDLIFRYVQPKPNGHLQPDTTEGMVEVKGRGDSYFDVTRPCPPACGDGSN